MGENSVERDASVFVGVETLIKKVAQKAAVLRNAFAVNAGRGRDRIGGMLGVGGEVADRSEPPASHNRIGDGVNVFVNLARLKSAVQMDIPVAGGEFAFDGLRKLPLSARDFGALSIARVANGEHVAWIFGGGHRIFGPTNAAENEMSQRNFRHDFRGHQIAAQQAGDRLSIFFRNRGEES